ncbi:hypothetical protein RJ639_015324 [Escallonia herrerae]|uniref:50S ribosomal protein L18, chloroplastic n=1 Tax=Escallonia herrerae TaxID=1293975 RepID=A0AA88VG79_9ASTE|nr:hypothetical protein RJ639_015324 [Escallonia herrerae]
MECAVSVLIAKDTICMIMIFFSNEFSSAFDKLRHTKGVDNRASNISSQSSEKHKMHSEIKIKRAKSPQRYMLRLFISLKYITANVVDRNNGRIVATASTVEHALKGTLECGRSCNAKAAAVVGEVLAMRLKVEGLEQGQDRGIHVNINREIEKKGFKNQTKVWAVVNTLKNNGVKLILDDDDDTSTSRPK